jgi:murein DD-endopeptidase MepM/ murein hydrolase activator NlpD
MDKRFYTLLISSGAHGKLHKIQIPQYALRLMAGFSLVGLLTVGLLATSYARMLWKVANYNDVRSQREALQTQYKALESTVKQTNAKLNSLQSLASEVAIRYGFGETNRPKFPRALFDLAAQSDSTVDSGYRASLYLFNTMELAATDPAANSLLSRGLVSRFTNMDSAALPSLWPVRGEITAVFGQRMDPFSGEEAFHPGVDIAAPYGTTVQSTGDGMVVEAGVDAGYGKCIVIDHGSGITTRYGHLSRIFVVVGEDVKKGEIIGDVGATGRATGPHLHYEVRVHDTPVNPSKFLQQPVESPLPTQATEMAKNKS